MFGGQSPCPWNKPLTVRLKLYFIFYIMMLLYLNLCVKLWLFVFKKEGSLTGYYFDFQSRDKNYHRTVVYCVFVLTDITGYLLDQFLWIIMTSGSPGTVTAVTTFGLQFLRLKGVNNKLEFGLPVLTGLSNFGWIPKNQRNFKHLFVDEFNRCVLS